MIRIFRLCLAGLLALSASALAHDVPKPTVATITSLTQVERHVTPLAAKYGTERTLVVFDIDNTLLITNQDLGSDAWFRWQAGLQNQQPKSEYDVTTKDYSFLDVQTLLHRLSDMKPTEASTPALVRTLQGRGHPVMALSARGTGIRSATLRELGDSEILFRSAPRCGPPLCGRRGTIAPSQVAWAAEQARFTFANIAGWLEKRRAKIRPIGYGNGVMTVAGQDKGVMLQLLLASSDLSRYRAVVFVDDGANNIANVERAFSHPTLEVVALHYTRFKKNVEDLPKDPKRQATANAAWKAVQEIVCGVFGRFCAKE